MKDLIFPPRKRPFYLLEPFLQHEHNANSCESAYIIPWTSGFFVTTKRLRATQGCIECLVRRLLSTTYHKTAIINGVDSVWCKVELETNQDVLEAAKQTLQIPNNPTLCQYFKWNSKTYREIHIIPVPSCNCTNQEAPKLDHNFVNKWLKQWPNVILNKFESTKIFFPFLVKSVTLPNTSWLFSTNLNQQFHIPSNPTAAAFKDSPSLQHRLVGESIERYSLKYLPQNQLYLDKYYRENATKNHIQNSSSKIWTSVFDLEGNCQPIEADRVYNLLFRVNHEKYNPISSSGVAAHPNPENAKCNALLELLERDALLTSWRLTEHSEALNLTELPDDILRNVREIDWLPAVPVGIDKA
ncbi:MAG: YcaO-like family protein [Waddliaceae bacterium]